MFACLWAGVSWCSTWGFGAAQTSSAAWAVVEGLITPAALQQCPACFYRWDGNLLLLRGTVEGGVGALAIR